MRLCCFFVLQCLKFMILKSVCLKTFSRWLQYVIRCFYSEIWFSLEDLCFFCEMVGKVCRYDR